MLLYYLLTFYFNYAFLSAFCSAPVETATRGGAVCNNSLESACPDLLVWPLQRQAENEDGARQDAHK